ncbi:MAG TPA: insulinase family protein, partial [Candidatus Saccharimonadales bacterium]|nr:insulinase family protein [Candidatus Saccharimonadales bacterium]
PEAPPKATAAAGASETPPAAAPLPAPDALLGFDPQVRKGRLDNGLTWYIRRNAEPEGRAELWLAVDAGSMQEDDDQRGLAHFVEHMAFDGTRRFAAHEIVDFLELAGMRFGADINASTSFDETVYTLTLPTEDALVLDKGMEILSQWASAITFDPNQIDTERKVVLEERRLGRGADARMRDLQLPVIFKGSRYAERLPIGQKSILGSAGPADLRRFYADWYRPDLMAVIAVGDFDEDRMEARIRERFGGLRNPAHPRERKIWPVPDNPGTLVTIATDPEATRTSLRVYCKLPQRVERTTADYRRSLVELLQTMMLNDRFDEIRQRPDPPFLFALCATDSLVRSREVSFLAAGVEEGGIDRGLEALLTEAERVARHGFTPTELDRARADLLRAYEQAYRERSKEDSSSLAAEMLRNFLEEEPMPGIEAERALARGLVPGIGLDDVNGLAAQWFSGENRVIAVSAPETKTGEPPATRDGLLAIFRKVESSDVAPWVDRVVERPLVAHPPEPGRIVRESREKEIGVTRWTLSNGVRVILKPTDFKNDEILLSGYSPGGTSLVSDADYPSALLAVPYVRASGLGEFDAAELQKALAGRVAGASPWISELEEGVSGSASPEDLETMLQLVYLDFTAPRADPKAWDSLLTRYRGAIQNRLSRPETVFGDRMAQALSQDHPRRRPLSEELLARADPSTAIGIYRDRFADAGDFTFTLVGNFDPNAIEPEVLTWLGGLPSAGRAEAWKDVGVRPPAGVVKVEVRKGLEPKSLVQIVFTGETPWSAEDEHDMESLADLLRLRLREVLREKMGATYGVSVDGAISPRPAPGYSFGISFGCAPDSVETSVDAVFREIESVKESGASDAEVAKIREAQSRERETDLRENGFWLSVLEAYDRRGEDPGRILDYDRLVARVTSDALAASARRWLDTGRYVEGVLLPEGKR